MALDSLRVGMVLKVKDGDPEYLTLRAEAQVSKVREEEGAEGRWGERIGVINLLNVGVLIAKHF